MYNAGRLGGTAVRLGSAWPGLARPGSVRLGLAWLGPVRLGSARLGRPQMMDLGAKNVAILNQKVARSKRAEVGSPSQNAALAECKVLLGQTR